MRIAFCGNCDFYVYPECRRFPPQPVNILVDNQTGLTQTCFVYAEVGADTPCCGEFRAQEAAIREPLRAYPEDRI